MKKIIHHLRRQPEQVRTHILHLLTIGAFVILMILWVYSLGKTVTSAETQKKIGEDIKPFSVLKDNLVGGYQSLSEQREPELPAENSNQNYLQN